jgi:hypothetical protein
VTARRPASIAAYIGASGCGKTTALRAEFLQPAPDRLAVWDFKREYAELPIADNARAILLQLGRPRFAFRVLAPLNQQARAPLFDLWCRAVYAAGNCTAIIEEAAFVTTPQRAPDAWRLMILTGRDYTLSGRRSSLRLAFTSQRPASIDKDALGNCSAIWCGRLTAERDLLTMGRALGVPADELRTLADLQFIKRDVLRNAVDRGTLRLAPKAGNSTRRR